MKTSLPGKLTKAARRGFTTLIQIRAFLTLFKATQPLTAREIANAAEIGVDQAYATARWLEARGLVVLGITEVRTNQLGITCRLSEEGKAVMSYIINSR
jgi:hypothetical protein